MIVLKERIITALVLVPLVLLAIFKLPNMYFAIAMAAVLLLGVGEWLRLTGVEKKPLAYGYRLLVGAAMYGLYICPFNEIYMVASVWWLVALCLVVTYPKSTSRWSAIPGAGFIMGFLVLLPTWGALVYLQALDNGAWFNNGAWYVMYLMVMVWGADTGAYFSGRRWGKRKLAPNVSPGKSIAGLVGGLALTACIALVVGLYIDLKGMQLITMLAISMVTVLASVLGDLYESMMKRHRGIKDSGNILPGHGGILDRIDSLTAAAPVFVAGLLLVGA